ncbi:MAG TPA: cbb3-type cytochrome c oxidase subunit 3 [Planctomycetes bacterium]|nr:cbb3-type cytochrome c oxidase subunit 3 [Planctomycetota bacterium]
MIKEFFSRITLLHWPTFAMVFFILFFTGVLLWVWVLHGKKDYEEVERLPLEEDENLREVKGK